MSKKRLSEGDIFYVNVNDKYIFARILLDVNSRILKHEPEHNIKFFAGCYLIEVYKGIYDSPILTTKDIILPSQYTFKKYFYSKTYNVEWIFYEHEPIDYTKLDFPEILKTGDNGLINFTKFDLSIPTSTQFEDWPKIENDKSSQKFTSSICGSFYQMIDESLHLQGRDELMRVSNRTHFLDNNDLRLNINFRDKFYKQIEENLNQNYYEMALKHGYDLGRFYNK